MNRNILVLCTGNSCRSQIAEGYLRHFAQGKAVIYSAGLAVHGVNPRAVAIMAEDGIDISWHSSNHVDEYRGLNFDWVITVCEHANEGCPVFPAGAQRFHQNFPDPARAAGTEAAIQQAFREVREQIKTWAAGFIQQHFDRS